MILQRSPLIVFALKIRKLLLKYQESPSSEIPHLYLDEI